MPANGPNGKTIGEQTLDWRSGYIFRYLESMYLKAIKAKEEDFILEVDLPKSWFGLRPITDPNVCISNEIAEAQIEDFESLFAALCKKWQIKKISLKPWEQYMRLYVEAERTIKRMTKSEIEKLLGYKIEIVQEDVI